jgi:hypothetical protein
MRNGGDRVASSRAIDRSAGISAAFRGRQHDVRRYETGDESRSSGTKKVLIVEDNDLNMKLFNVFRGPWLWYTADRTVSRRLLARQHHPT